MAVLGMQLALVGDATVAANANVVFNQNYLSSDTNITYNSSTGVLTFAAAGSYYIAWSVSPLTADSGGGCVFALQTNAALYSSGSNVKNGEVSGTLMLSATAGMTVSLINYSGGTVRLSGGVSANLSVLNTAIPPVTREGFSAFLSNLSVSGTTQLSGWSVAAPYFASPSGSFNATTGSYTVPETGTYMLLATINYNTTAALSASIGGGVNPSFQISQTSPTATTLITGLLPVLNINVTLLTLRALLGSGSVNLAGEVQLTAGSVVELFYQSSGLTLNLNLGGSGGGIVWSIQRIV